MGEIDNPKARQCWICDNVRQRSSMNRITLCCVVSGTVSLSSPLHVLHQVGSLLKLDFHKLDLFLFTRVLEPIRVCTDIL